MVPGFSYALSNVNTIVEIALFPGMNMVVEGLMTRSPLVSLPVQNCVPRLAYCRVRTLLSDPPDEAFQATWTFRTVTGSCGLVIVMLMVLPNISIFPAVILSHPAIAVGVAVGVEVEVGVEVGVDDREIVGVIVGVSVGSGVKVTTGPEPGVAVAVAVGVSVGRGDVAVGVSDGVGLAAAGVFVEPDPASSSTSPRMVRALDEVIVRGGIGIRLTMGL